MSLRRADGPRYYHFDGLGSTTELTDAAEAVTDSYRYEAFGNLTGQAGNTRNAYRYVGSLGYYADADSGLMLLGARYYAAGVGRFVTVDPAREGGNGYAYVGNNPINNIDPTGLQTYGLGGYPGQPYPGLSPFPPGMPGLHIEWVAWMWESQPTFTKYCGPWFNVVQVQYQPDWGNIDIQIGPAFRLEMRWCRGLVSGTMVKVVHWSNGYEEKIDIRQVNYLTPCWPEFRLVVR